jgi:hypothetical protein
MPLTQRPIRWGFDMQPRSEEFHAHAAECEDLAKWYGGPIKHQYEQLAHQWRLLAEQEENRRTPQIIGDPVLLCVAPRS